MAPSLHEPAVVSEKSLKPYYPELSRLGKETRLPPGAVLWKEGDPGDSVVVLLDGTLEVVHEGEGGQVVVLRTLESGAVVGELALADGRPRSATVRARSGCRILKIAAADFRNLLRRRADILEQLYWLQVERVRSLTSEFTRSHQRSITDPLTRLYNFGFFRERLEMEIARARATTDVVSLVIMDIDHFKHYNDTNGHQEGNVVLVTVAEIVRTSGRKADIMARYGGEEFVAMLYGETRDEAVAYAERVRETVASSVFAGGPRQPGGRVTLSAGVATFPGDAQDGDALIKAADAQLYRAKQAGRNRVFRAGMAPRVDG